MKTTLNEKLIAYLALLSGLSVSAVAVYYSVAGLTAIFSAAIIPIMIMGISLEIGKIIATVWLKQNWKIAPLSIKAYLCVAVALLMVITSMGIFGFLSKAHSDQNLVSGDVLSKIAVYDEKIQTEKENIDANRRALKQLDDSVDQVMGRSQDEKGAEKAVAIRKAQQKERSRLAQDIADSQKRITSLNEERAPIATEVRKVEAEVGPIKYIAAFVYGNTDSAILERAVTWVIILIIIVFDPLALILLISSQISFQQFRERENSNNAEPTVLEQVTDVAEEPSTEEPIEVEDQLSSIKFTDHGEHPKDTFEYQTVKVATDTDNTPTLEEEEAWKEISNKLEPVVEPVVETVITPPVPVLNREESTVTRTKVFPRKSVVVPLPETYVQNEEQQESNVWSKAVNAISQDDYVAKSEEAQQTAVDGHEDHVIYLAANIRAGRMHMNEVPEELRERVKARL